MPGVGPVLRKWLESSDFLDDLQGCTSAAIKASTSLTKTIRVPQFIPHEGIETFAGAYNKSHPDSPDVGSSFGSPAFAIANEVHVRLDCGDWFVDGDVNECKLVSTMVHEFLHAVSHNAVGLQADDEPIFKGPGSYCYMDEIITDLYGYLVYTAMDLGSEFDGAYDSAYLCPKSSSSATSVGNKSDLQPKGGCWLSTVFFAPVFDDHRRAIVKRYFHGGSLAGFEMSVSMSDLVKGTATMTSDGPNYGMPYSLSRLRTSWGARVSTAGLSGLQNIDVAEVGYKIPVNLAGALSALLTPELGSDPVKST